MNTEITEEEKATLEQLRKYVEGYDVVDWGVTKAVLTKPFIEICKLGKILGFNRQFDEFSMLNLEGVHILTCVVYDHQTADNNKLDKHHRCLASLSVRGTDEPLEMGIDILHSKWEELPLAEEYLKVMKQVKANNQRLLTTYMENRWGDVSN
jgi:hypothetical protein